MKIEQVAAQLFTLRDFCKTPPDIAASLRKVREIGYRAVQASGIGPIEAADLRKLADDLDLVICATHEPGTAILNEPEAVCDRLQTLGCKYTAYPFPAGVDLTDRRAVSGLAEGLNRAGAVLAARGCRLAYHNHAHEFFRHGDQTVLEILLAETDPRFLAAELDTYWVQYGGGDPVRWCSALTGRLPLLHLKDYSPSPEFAPTYREIGYGNLDFRLIIDAAEQAGCEWFIVEQDVCPGDPFESMRKSFDYIAANLV